jgi:hypothetical protein
VHLTLSRIIGLIPNVNLYPDAGDELAKALSVVAKLVTMECFGAARTRNVLGFSLLIKYSKSQPEWPANCMLTTEGHGRTLMVHSARKPHDVHVRRGLHTWVQDSVLMRSRKDKACIRAQLQTEFKVNSKSNSKLTKLKLRHARFILTYLRIRPSH